MNLIYSISSLLPRTTIALYARKRIQIGGLTHLSRQGGMKQAARDWLNRTDADATGNGILNVKNESDVRTGLTSVCQLLYFFFSFSCCSNSLQMSLVGQE